MATQDPADDIDEGIHHSHFMKMDVLDGNSMGETFCFRQSIEYQSTAFLDRVWERAGRHNLTNASESQWLLKSVLNDDIDFCGGQRATLHFTFVESVSFELQGLKAGDQFAPGQPGVHQGSQHHVPADSRETIEMQMSAHYIPRPAHAK
jgi:hypothetical protein